MSVTQVKSTFSSMGHLDPATPPGSLVLSLGLTTEAIRYFIHSYNHKQVVFYGNYQLHHVEDEAELAERLQKIYENDEALQLAYYKAFIGLDSPYTLVPDSLAYFNNDASRVPLQQSLAPHWLKLHFQAGPELRFKIRSLFPAGELVHLTSSFLRHLPLASETLKDSLYLDIHASHFDALRFDENGVLQLMNRYAFKTRNDFAYFLMLVCSQLNLDREKTSLILMGEIDMQSEIYKMCYKYFRRVSFIPAPKEVQFSKEFETYPKHQHFNLYALGI